LPSDGAVDGRAVDRGAVDLYGRPAEAAAIAAAALEYESADAILRWALDRYGRKVAIASSFGGPSSLVVLDMALRIDRGVAVTYIDTGVLFAETHTLIDRVRKHYGIEVHAIRTRVGLAEQAKVFGEALWSRDPDLCCALRKVLPQGNMLHEYDAWITGLRRDQSDTRKQTPVVEWDSAFGLVKVNPLAGWTENEVWDHIKRRGIPYNELHDRGYPSIGCTHCTAPVAVGESPRAGRWRNFSKTECGLHGSR
jgi:phosphoadenosine phosphosulfate reductase